MSIDQIAPEVRDSANRMRDAVNMHLSASLELGRDRPGYVAIRLADGRSPDGTLYDDRKSVFRFNSEPGIFAVKVGKESMGESEAITYLQLNRKAWANGVRFADEEPLVPHLKEIVGKYLPNTIRKLHS